MFCKKCHKRITKEVKTVNAYKNSCACLDNFQCQAVLTNTEINGYVNSLSKNRRLGKINRRNERLVNKIIATAIANEYNKHIN